MKTLNPEEFSSFEPKIKNRFIVTLGEPFNNVPSYVMKSINKPGIKASNNSNELFRDPVIISMYDPTSIQLSSIILEAISVLKKQEEPYVNIHIDLINPTGDVVEKWDIKSKFRAVDFGTLDWSSDNLSEISLTFDTINVKIKCGGL